MHRIFALVAVAFAWTTLDSTAHAQAAPSAQTCANQYADAPGVTAVKLIRGGYEIKAGWPGGLWLQKNLETYFCNTGRQRDDAVFCWTLQDPVKGGACQ
jgi:hypothetical protein